jgi:hypothetical protein
LKSPLPPPQGSNPGGSRRAVWTRAAGPCACIGALIALLSGADGLLDFTPNHAFAQVPAANSAAGTRTQPVELGPVELDIEPAPVASSNEPPPTGDVVTPDQATAVTSAAPSDQAIVLSSQYAWGWQQGREAVWLLRGQCRILQGDTELTAREVVLWRLHDPVSSPPVDHLTVYLDGQARMVGPEQSAEEPTLLVEMKTSAGVSLDKRTRMVDAPAEKEPVYKRAAQRRQQARTQLASHRAEVHATQYAPELIDPNAGVNLGPDMQAIQLQPPAGGMRRIRIFPRSAVQPSIESFESPDTVPPEQVILITGGVNLLIDGVAQAGGTVDLSADRMVIWTTSADEAGLAGDGQLQSSETPFQVYLEGNIIIRQGSNTVRAARAFVDARENRALMINAELMTSLPEIGSDVRIRAAELRQISDHQYQGTNAWISTSKYGEPGYRMQVSDIFVEPWEDDWYFGAPERDPATGEYDDPVLWATSTDNTFYLGNVPLAYFPKLSFPAEDPNIPLRNIRVGNDRVLGTQLYTTWNLFKLLGVRRPANTRLDLHADYFHKRGIQGGLTGRYGGANRFGWGGTYEGNGLSYIINDSGLDTLGGDRRDLQPAQDLRSRTNIWDRQLFDDGHELYTEFSWLTDRNVLEQFDERTYDSDKDYENVVSLSRSIDNDAYAISIEPRLYDYYNQQEYLPRGDLYTLSEPLLGGWVNWSQHSYATYATSEIAEKPTDPRDPYTVLPFEGNFEGGVFMTRHQVDAPFNLGAVKVVPYAMGEAAYWGDDYNGNEFSRLYGNAGVRSSLEFWKVFPEVESSLFDLHGLAHKVTLFADYSYAESTQPLSRLPYLNTFDDNAQEQYRRRIAQDVFQGPIPTQFDPRSYALRSGAATSVTSPYHELVDDRQALTFGIQQRLQTKRGPINNQRITNWMTLDLETTFFPDAKRDNFDEPFGLYGARYNWFVGDLTTIMASAYFDTFDNAQRIYNVGVLSRRDTRGSLYLGFRSIEGLNLKSQIVTASYSYHHSDKWISTVATAYDIGTQNNLGQSITLTRAGADFLVHAGFNVDATRSNVGFMLSVEPRLFRGTQGLTQLGSLLAPPPR